MVEKIAHDAPVLVIGLGRFGAATAGQLQRLDREVLEALVDRKVLQLAAKRDGMVVGDTRVREAIEGIAAFQVDGVFDQQRYLLSGKQVEVECPAEVPAEKGHTFTCTATSGEDSFEVFEVEGFDEAQRNILFVRAHNGHDIQGLWEFDTSTKSFGPLIYRRSDVDVVGVRYHSNSWTNHDTVVAVSYAKEKLFDPIGMTSARTRERLIQRLRDQGITNASVLDQIRNVPRHLFVDEALATRAYEDTALPIGHGQTISQPFVVARMTEALIEAANAAGYRYNPLAGALMSEMRRSRAAATPAPCRRARDSCDPPRSSGKRLRASAAASPVSGSRRPAPTIGGCIPR
mgnify:CR=1 FL=1